MVWPEIAKTNLVLKYFVLPKAIPSDHISSSLPSSPLTLSEDSTKNFDLCLPKDSILSGNNQPDEIISFLQSPLQNTENFHQLSNEMEIVNTDVVDKQQKQQNELSTRGAFVPDCLDLEDLLDCFLQSVFLDLPPPYFFVLPSGLRLYSTEFKFHDFPSCAEVCLRDLALQIGDIIQISCLFENEWRNMSIQVQSFLPRHNDESGGFQLLEVDGLSLTSSSDFESPLPDDDDEDDEDEEEYEDEEEKYKIQQQYQQQYQQQLQLQQQQIQQLQQQLQYQQQNLHQNSQQLYSQSQQGNHFLFPDESLVV